jgi:hypothetical protein
VSAKWEYKAVRISRWSGRRTDLNASGDWVTSNDVAKYEALIWDGDDAQFVPVGDDLDNMMIQKLNQLGMDGWELINMEVYNAIAKRDDFEDSSASKWVDQPVAEWVRKIFWLKRRTSS